MKTKTHRGIMEIAMVAILSLFGSFAHAQDDLWGYVQKHASFVGGVVVVDDQKEKLVELRIVDDFEISGKFRGAFRLGLFSITRAGENAPQATIPTSIEEVKAYSDGEGWLSVYRDFNANFALECTGGVTFKMASVTGQVGDPLDGTKFAAACGPRVSYAGNQVSILGGHFGPVSAGGKLAGPVPSVLIHAYIPLTFLGKNTAFVPDLAFGATPDPLDPSAARTITRTLRLGIATRF